MIARLQLTFLLFALPNIENIKSPKQSIPYAYKKIQYDISEIALDRVSPCLVCYIQMSDAEMIAFSTLWKPSALDFEQKRRLRHGITKGNGNRPASPVQDGAGSESLDLSNSTVSSVAADPLSFQTAGTSGGISCVCILS